MIDDKRSGIAVIVWVFVAFICYVIVGIYLLFAYYDLCDILPASNTIYEILEPWISIKPTLHVCQ